MLISFTNDATSVATPRLSILETRLFTIRKAIAGSGETLQKLDGHSLPVWLTSWVPRFIREIKRRKGTAGQTSETVINDQSEKMGVNRLHRWCIWDQGCESFSHACQSHAISVDVIFLCRIIPESQVVVIFETYGLNPLARTLDNQLSRRARCLKDLDCTNNLTYRE